MFDSLGRLGSNVLVAASHSQDPEISSGYIIWKWYPKTGQEGPCCASRLWTCIAASSSIWTWLILPDHRGPQRTPPLFPRARLQKAPHNSKEACWTRDLQISKGDFILCVQYSTQGILYKSENWDWELNFSCSIFYEQSHTHTPIWTISTAVESKWDIVAPYTNRLQLRHIRLISLCFHFE